MRTIVLAICVALVLAGCGDREPTLGEYADELEELVSTMTRKISVLDAELGSRAVTVEGMQDYFSEKIAARQELLEGFRAIEPPEAAAEMQAAALDTMTRLTAAEEALARRVDEFETAEELSDLWNTEEGLAVLAVDEEAMAFCEAAQAEFDSTADREVFEEVPWIPSELKEVVQVFFGCSR